MAATQNDASDAGATPGRKCLFFSTPRHWSSKSSYRELGSAGVEEQAALRPVRTGRDGP